jgi:hypothetical protein
VHTLPLAFLTFEARNMSNYDIICVSQKKPYLSPSSSSFSLFYDQPTPPSTLSLNQYRHARRTLVSIAVQ